MNPRQSSSDIARLYALVAGVVVVATLFFARAVLVPFALAMLFSFLLAPLVTGLEKLRLPRIPAVLLAVTLAMATVFTLAVKVTNQLVDVTTQLPTYRTNIRNKIASLHNGQNLGVVRATQQVSELSAEMVNTLPGTAERSHPQKGRALADSKADRPIEVQVVRPPGDAWGSLLTVLTPLGLGGVVLVFTIFILLRLADLRNRFIRLVGHRHINVTTQALDDASQRIAKYLLFQFIVNASYGLVIGVGLHFIGLPNALLWGVIAAVFRFLPFVGPLLGAFLPIVLSLAVFDGWMRTLIIVALYFVIEIVVANFIEPLLYAANTGLSSLAIMVAAVFWTLLWGPIGLVLSTPLTVCLIVLGRHVPQMEFLHVLLGDEPVLTPDTHFYQRMLASDLSEARQVLDQHLQGKQLQELYDAVVIPALSLAQRDCRQNDLDEAAVAQISQSTRELVEELNEEYNDPHRAALSATTDCTPQATAVASGGLTRIVCVPARTPADDTIAAMLVQLLERAGEQAAYLPLASVPQTTDRLVADNPDIVVVSALQPFGLTHARKLFAQIRMRLPAATIMLGLWNLGAATPGVSARFGPDMQGLIFTSLSEAVEKLGSLSRNPPAVHESDAVAVSR